MDGVGGKISYEYNKADQIWKIHEQADISITQSTQEIFHTPNTVNSRETVTTEYGYENGLLKTVKDKEGGISSYSYDEAGNIRTVTDPNQNMTTYAYDSMHRVTGVSTAVNDQMAAYTYNKDGLLETEKNGRGQERSYTYDSLGRVKKVKDEEGTITYTYDANGNIETVKDKN